MKNEATGKLLLFRKNKESGEDNSVINLIDKKIKNGGRVTTASQKHCSYITREIIEKAESRIFIVINKRSPCEIETYNDEKVLEAISEAKDRGVSIYIIFSQFDTSYEVFPSKIFGVLRKDKEGLGLIEISIIPPGEPSVGIDHHSLVFSENVGSRVKNEYGHDTSHFEGTDDSDMWADFLLQHFRWIRTKSKIIPLK